LILIGKQKSSPNLQQSDLWVPWSYMAWSWLCCWWYVWLHTPWLGPLYFPILLSISWLPGSLILFCIYFSGYLVTIL